MSTLRSHDAPAVVPHWARTAAHVVALLPLPSSLWRVALVLGAAGGYTAEGLAELDLDGTGKAWLVVLSLLSEGAALLSFGLVRRWGEVLPRWVPGLGGRVVRPGVAVVPATLGTVVVGALWTPMLWWWSLPHPDMTETGAVVVGLLYLPMVLWAPLLAALTLAYRRRRAADATSRP